MPDIYFDVDTALAEVPVNIAPLIDNTTFKDIEDAVAYNAAGMALRWHFVTSAGAYTVTSVTPTTGGNYDWTDQGDSGIYTIEIPASGGASINNDTEGYGWFTGSATGILPWRSPIYGFRAAAINDALCDGGDILDVSVTQWTGTNVATPSVGGVPEVDITHFNGTAGTFAAGRPEVNTTHIAGTTVSTSTAHIGVNVVNAAGTAWGSGAITAGVIATDAIGALELASDAVAEIADAVWDEARAGHVAAGSFGEGVASVQGNVTGNVGGNVTGSVGSIASGGIVAASFATDAITNTALAASAITEIQTGLATQTSVDTVDTVVDAIKVKTDYLPSATAGSAGGVFIAGSNAATSITTALTANITGNLSGSVGSVASGGITAASIADDAIDAAALASDVGTEIADAILARDLGSGSNAGTENERTVRSALRFLRNKWSIATGTLTVTTENDTTTAWTTALTTDEAAQPVTASDPTGP